MKRIFNMKKKIPEFLFNSYIDRKLYGESLSNGRKESRYDDKEYKEELNNLKKIFRKYPFGYKIEFLESEFDTEFLSEKEENDLEKLFLYISEDLTNCGLVYYLIEEIKKNPIKKGSEPGFLYCYGPIFGNNSLSFVYNNWEDYKMDIYTIHPFLKENEQTKKISNIFINNVCENLFLIVSIENVEKNKISVMLKKFNPHIFITDALGNNVNSQLHKGGIRNGTRIAINLDVIGFDILNSEKNKLIDVTNQEDVGSINSYLFSSNFVVISAPGYKFKLPDIDENDISKNLPYKQSYFTDALRENTIINNVYERGFYNFFTYVFYKPTNKLRNINRLRPEETTDSDRIRWRYESCMCGSGSVRDRCRIRNNRRNRGSFTRLWEPEQFMSIKTEYNVFDQNDNRILLSGYMVLSFSSVNHVKREKEFDDFRLYEIQNEHDEREVYSKIAGK